MVEHIARALVEEIRKLNKDITQSVSSQLHVVVGSHVSMAFGIERA